MKYQCAIFLLFRTAPFRLGNTSCFIIKETLSVKMRLWTNVGGRGTTVIGEIRERKKVRLQVPRDGLL